MLYFYPVSPSQPFCRQGGGADPTLSPACRGFTSKCHHLQAPAFRWEVFLPDRQEWDFHECDLTENDFVGVFLQPPGVNEVS